MGSMLDRMADQQSDPADTLRTLWNVPLLPDHSWLVADCQLKARILHLFVLQTSFQNIFSTFFGVKTMFLINCKTDQVLPRKLIIVKWSC